MEITKVLDSNGNELVAGDSVSITQNIKVKGASDLKRGDTVKNIRLYDEDNIEGRLNGTMMVIKTCYIKKLMKKKKKK